MKRNYDNLIKSVKHLQVLHKTFTSKRNFTDPLDFELYKDNKHQLEKLLSNPEFEFYQQLYNTDTRQMILADVIEYIFFARGLFSIEGNKPETKKLKKGLFIKNILYFVNLLMLYESMTIDNKLRKRFLLNISKYIPSIKDEKNFVRLRNFNGKIGLKKDDIDADENLNSYFDKMLPKTAGGLWHELLVFAFLLRNDLGYVIPLLLNQRILSGSNTLVPPDFLLLTKDKHIYGIEVGDKKEIQSGSFSLTTAIPTATIDTRNSRCSDRCPICHKWILLCDQIITEYSNMDFNIETKKVKCLESCRKFNKKDILQGKCPYAKYSRNSIRKISHKYTTGLHYHYRCVLQNLTKIQREKLIKSQDSTAIKTHYPYYTGLEMLFKSREDESKDSS